jgi:hypothetical protein
MAVLSASMCLAALASLTPKAVRTFVVICI